MRVLSLPGWRLEHELPAAVVIAAMRLGGGDYIRGLNIIASDLSRWPGRVARWLLDHPEELQQALDDVKHGIRVSDEVMDEVLGVIGA